MDSKKNGLSLAELLAVVVIMGVLAAVSIVLVSNIIDNTRAKAVEADADAYLDALNLYCLDSANFEAEICNLNSDSEDIYIASEDETNVINTEVQDHVSKDFEEEYDSGKLYYDSSVEATILELNVGEYSVRYYKGFGGELSNVYYQNSDGPFDEEIQSYGDAITIIGTSDGLAEINNGFSTNADSILIDYGDINVDNVLYSGDVDDHTFNTIEISNSEITSINVVSDIDTLIFSGDTITKDEYNSYSTNLINVKNIVAKNNASINSYQDFIYARRKDWFVNNINSKMYSDYSYKEATPLVIGDGTGVIVDEVINDSINLETQDNSILLTYLTNSANIFAEASGNSICAIENNPTGSFYSLTISNITDNAVVAIKGYKDDGTISNPNNYLCFDQWGWYLFYNSNENEMPTDEDWDIDDWENHWDSDSSSIS